MAAGDVVNALSSVANGSYLDMITSGAGEETVVHNVLFGGAVEFYYYDGSNSIKFDAASSFGAKLGCVFHNTYTKYYRIKNVSGGSIYIGFDGQITKVAS